MILREATIKYSGRDPDKLSKWSKERICCSCDICGKIRWLPKQGYHDLCNKCSKLHGKDHPNWKGGKVTLICKECGNEYKVIKARENKSKFCSMKCHDIWRSKNRLGKNHPNWKGGDIIKICKWCNINFKSKLANNKKFCSNECFGKWMSENLSGENTSNWQGGISDIRDHVLPINKCICLNERFNNSHFHHITKSIGIYIPSELHNHLYHNLKNGQGMGSMNMLALQFINEGL